MSRVCCRLKISTKNPALWLFLIAMFIAAPAAETDVAAQIPQKANASQARVKELERNLAFERHWGKELGKALQMTDKLSVANSELGSLFRLAADVVSSGASEDMIKEKIGKVNSRIEPYFRVDDRGNLHWGSALQVGIMMSGTVPSQFAVGLPEPPPLTLKEAVGILNGWQQKNQQQMRKNEQELKTLLAEPSKPPDEETPGETAAQGQLEGYRGQLNALTARLKKVEDTIPEFEREKAEYKAKWAEEELTMKLHLAAAQKALKEASEAGDIIRSINLGAALISESLDDAKRITGSVTEETASLNFIYSAYAVAATEASTAANKVCDYASRAASQPSPTADEIAGWISESGDLITGASVSVKYADKEVTARIESLNSDISRLRTTLDNLSSARLAILADFSRLEQIKGNLDEAEKDIKRAEKIWENYLNTNVSEIERIKGRRGKDIGDLRTEAEALAQAVRGRDRQLEAGVAQLQARIEAAQDKIAPDWPSRPPGIPELGPEFYDLRAKLEGLDEKKSTFEEKFAPVDSAIADGRKAISDAEGGMATGASATKNAPADLERARQCYASLKGTPPEEETVAQGPLGEFRRQLNALTARLKGIEDAIRGLQELKAKYDEEELTMKLHIAAAQTAVNETSKVLDILMRLLSAKESIEKFISENLGEARQITGSVTEKTADLNLVYSAYALVAMDASEDANKVCDYASRAASQPPPTADEMAGWISESDGLINEASVSVQDADKEVAAQITSLDSDISSLRTILKAFEGTLSRREAIFADIKRIEQIKRNLDDAEKDIKRAKEIREKYLEPWLKGMIQGRDLAVEKKEKDIEDLRTEAGALAQAVRGKDPQLEADVAQLQARIEAAAGKVWIDLPSRPPEVPYKLGLDIESLRGKWKEADNIRPAFEEKFALIDSAITAGRKAISDAEGAVAAGAFATKNAPANLERARQCYASLEKAKEAIQKIEEKLYADAQAALDSCDFERARSLIDQMPVGSKRTELDQKHQASVGLENSLKALVEKANGEYGSRNYEAALSTLKGALKQAKCDRHRESIDNKIAQVNATVLKVCNNAKAALDSCDFKKARKLIDLVPAGPKRTELDQKHQASVGLENSLKALVEKANGEYGSRNYEAALSTLKGALKQAKCDRHRESINNKIAQVNATVLYNNAKAALNSCDFKKARKLIDLVPPGTKRTELDQKYQALITFENGLKALVEKANGEYKNRNYEAALSILRGALDKAECDRHRESINNKIAWVMGKMGPTPEKKVATTVPPVRGENVEIAKMIIRDAKMVPSVNRKKRTSDGNKVDKVYDQNPSAGSPATQGDTVIIYVFSKAKAKSVQPGTQKGWDTPSIDSMVGKWNWVDPEAPKKPRPYGSPCHFFTKERGKFGYKGLTGGRYGKARLNCYWELQGKELVWKDLKGRVIMRFIRKGEGYWEGYDVWLDTGEKMRNPNYALARPREFYEERERDSSPGGIGAFDSSSGVTDPKRRQQLMRGTKITPHPKR